jgi:hypothetical protein
MVMRKIQKLNLKCKNAEKGCLIGNMNLKQAQKHIKLCTFETFICPWNCEGVNVPWKEFLGY